LLEKNINLLKYLFISILICYSSLIIDGYIQYFFGKNLFGIELYSNYRVSSFFGSELILGSYLARFFPILFGLFIFLETKKKNKLLLFVITIIFILSEGLIFLSGERLALFFMNLSAIYIILMLKEYKIYRLCTYLISLGLIAIMLILFPVSKQRLIDQTFNDFRSHSTEVGNKFYIFSKPHNDMYITAYRIFLDNKLFGVGPRQFRNTCEPYEVSGYSCETHPHNTYLELLSESGIFSFTMVMSVFILISFLSIKHFASKLLGNKKGFFNDFEVCLLSAMIISLWPFSPSGSFFNNWMSIVYYFPVGILLWQRTKYKGLIKKKNSRR
jgi:O-antigen ligase